MHKPNSFSAYCCAACLAIVGFFFACYLFHPEPSLASDAGTSLFQIKPESSGAYVNSQLAYFIDASDKMTAADVLQGAVFTPTEGRTGLGLQRHAVWLRLDVMRAADAPGQWWFEYLPYSVHDVQMFDARGGRITASAATGEGHPHSTRPFQYRQYLWPIDLPAGEKVTLLWRVESFNTRGIPMRVWQFQHWSEQTIKETLGVGLCFGTMAGLALYNLLLWARLRDKLYVLYSAQILSYLVFALDLHGYLSQFVLPESIHMLVGRSQALTNLYGVFVCAFAAQLLDTPTITRWWMPLMRSLIVLYVFAVIAALTGFAAIAGAIMQLAPMVWIPVLFGVGIYRSLQRYEPAQLYLIGYAPLLAGLITLLAFGEGGTSGSTWVQSIYLVAGAWEAVMFSQALASRVVGLSRERTAALEAAAEEKARRLAEALEHERFLESRVAERTAELAAEMAEHKRTSEQLRESQLKLEYMAYHDVLTGLPNRRLFDDRFQNMVAQSMRSGQGFFLALLDLDHFKEVNDTLGHDAGDMLIAEAGSRMQGAVRNGDSVARIGGDEFALLLAAPVQPADIDQICRRLLQIFAEPVTLQSGGVHCGVSIGVAGFPQDGCDTTALYRAADQALYKAKSQGRRRVCHYQAA
jgi:diguanylate cyclase (GGDEF)-like protein